MTRAVNFNGSFGIYAFGLKRLQEWRPDHSCGVIAYWYRSAIADTAAILTASTVYDSNYQLLVEHYLYPDAGIGPTLYLRRAGEQFFLRFHVDVDLPYNDGRWHHVIWCYGLNTDPVQFFCAVDGKLAVTLIGPYDHQMGLNFDEADQWNIGSRTVPDDPEYYQGDMAEVYFLALDQFITYGQVLGIDTAAGHIGGKGFYRQIDGTAMEIGPNGVGALGPYQPVSGFPGFPGHGVNYPPQIFCSGSAREFPFNPGGFRPDPSRAFEGGYNLGTASTDPFPRSSFP